MTDWLSAILAHAGADAWWWQAALIIAGTFILEDAATVIAAMQAASGGVVVWVALAALYAGIVLGDLGLYGLGALAARSGLVARCVPPVRVRQGRDWLRRNVFRVVFISRFIPGARLPTYTACGALHADLRRFALATVAATAIWTTLLFTLSWRIGALLIEHLGVWRWAGVAGFTLVVILAGRTARRLQVSAG